MSKPANLFRGIFALAVVALVAIAVGCGGGDGAAPAGPAPVRGIVGFNNGWIGVVDADRQVVGSPLLVGQLGTGVQLYDLALTPDGKTGIALSFGTDNVYLFDLTDPTAPGTPDNVTLSFAPEDVDLTPDGKFAVVSDGSLSPKLAVIDVVNRTLVEEFPPTPVASGYVPMYQAVAVAPDGQTVLALDYEGRKLNTLTIDAAGHLTWVGAIEVSPDNTLRPANVAISPDGRTAIVAAAPVGDNDAATVANMGFPVFRITAPGQVEYAGQAESSERLIAAQTIAFHPDGTKAYAYVVREMPVPAIDNVDDPAYPRNAIVVLDVTGAGAVSDSTTAWPVEFVNRSWLFGVETIAVDPRGRNLYVGNMRRANAKSWMQVLDLATGAVSKTISFGDVTNPFDNTVATATPISIAFPRN